MKKFIRFIFVLMIGIFVLIYSEPLGISGQFNETKKEGFDEDFIISDEVFTNVNSMTIEQIQAFLESKNSPLADKNLYQKYYLTYPTDLEIYNLVFPNRKLARESSPAEIIYYSGQIQIFSESKPNQINPQILLVLLEFNQGLIENPENLDQLTLDNALKFTPIEIKKTFIHYQGFLNQLIVLASQLTHDFQSREIGEQSSIFINGRRVVSKNKATSVLYIFNPSIAVNKILYKLYGKYFGIIDSSTLRTPEEAVSWALNEELNNPYGYYNSDKDMTYCLKFVEDAYNFYPRPWTCAKEAADSLAPLNPDDNPPYGSIAFYDWNIYGHSAIHIGNGTFLSPLLSQTNRGKLQRTGIYICGCTYRGWSYFPGTPKTLHRINGTQEVYWLQNNTLYWVTENAMYDMAEKTESEKTDTVLSRWGWNKICDYSSSLFNPNDHDLGPRFITTDTSSDGLLIRLLGDNKVYVMEIGERRWITTQEIFNERGYDWDDVIDVTQSLMNSVPEGDPITYGINPALKASTNSSGPWSTSVSGEQGTTFYFLGTGFTPDSTATQHIQYPDETDHTYNISVDSNGVLSWSYESNCDTPTGIYTIWVVDTTGQSSNEVSETIERSSTCNNPPQTPSTPSGPSDGYVGTSYSFSTSATDPDGDAINYQFDWGDGNISTWGSLTQSHSWSLSNTYSIKAQAKDSFGATSSWSSGKTITISACIPPSTPSNPYPSDGVTGVPIDTNLDWDDCTGTTSYDVYFGTTSSPPKVVTVTSSLYAPGTLTYNMSYYWKIIAKNSCGETSGPLWDFTTKAGISQYILTISATLGGTTDPAPGTHFYDADSSAEIEAISSSGYIFSHWTGDITSGDETDNPVIITMDDDKSITAHFSLHKEDLLGTWHGQGVYYRNSDDGTWVKMATPADLIACGDLDGDRTDDLIGEWIGQSVWVKYSSTGTWAKIASSAKDIASGDMNGDGREDFLGTWNGQGVFYKDSLSGTWAKIATHADLIAAGDLDGDGTDDLIGIWAGQGGVWVKYSSTGSWSKLSTTARDIASGDMNGDGTDDLIGTWDDQGVYYRDSDTGTWVKMASPADLIAAGDLDGDGTDDLIGIWAGQGGVWVKYSSTASWSKLSTTARDIASGNMSGGPGGGGLAGFIKLLAPIGGYAEGPENLVEYEDLSSKGPGGWNFVFQAEKNLAPKEKESMRIMKIHGPGEPGFRCIEQKNLVPQEEVMRKRGKKKEK